MLHLQNLGNMTFVFKSDNIYHNHHICFTVDIPKQNSIGCQLHFFIYLFFICEPINICQGVKNYSGPVFTLS